MTVMEYIALKIGVDIVEFQNVFLIRCIAVLSLWYWRNNTDF